jgi:ubiquinone/menaquinone biosynthesis C-methylase UbiE
MNHDRDEYSQIKRSLDLFEEKASKFDAERLALGYRIRYAMIANLLLEVSKLGATALDMGCGTGEYTMLMERIGFEVIGVDFSKAMLLMCHSKIKGLQESNQPQLVNSECSKLPFESNMFDVLACIAVLDCVPNYNELLGEAYRVLKDDGALIICVDSIWSPSSLCTNARELLQREKVNNSALCLQYKCLMDCMRVCGFAKEKFVGDIFLGQVLTGFLFNPEKNDVTSKILKIFQPIDSYLTRLSLLKPFSAHYIIQARKNSKILMPIRDRRS